MKEERLLYQIKSLEKMIFRAIVQEDDCLDNHPTPTQMQIMEYILEHRDIEIYQKDLENVLNLRRATVSGVLQTMEKNGLIERVSHLDDARVKKVILHPNAEAMFKEKEKKMQEFESVVVKEIDKKDLEVFSSVLKKMQENIKKVF